MRAGRTRTERLGIGIFGLLIAIFLLRAVVDTPGLSLVFLAVFPIVMAAFVLGRTATTCAWSPCASAPATPPLRDRPRRR